MESGELARLLVEASDAEYQALLRDNSVRADVNLAYQLKDFALDSWSSDPPRALRAAAVLDSLAKLKPDEEIVALALWAGGIEALVGGKMQLAIDRLDQAQAGFLAIGKDNTAAATQVSKLIALAMLGRYEEAVACGLGARDVFLADRDLLAAGKIEHNLGNLYFRRDHYRAAEKFHTAARERFLAVNNRKQLATINNCLANTHVLLHKFQSAEQLYDEAARQAEEAGVPVTQAEIEGNIGNFNLLRGRYDQALDYLERSRRRYASLGMPHQSAISELEIAEAYLDLNLAHEASEIYERVIPRFADLGMQAEEARALGLHGRALVALGLSGEAKNRLQRAQELYRREGNIVGEGTMIIAQAQLVFDQRQFADAATQAAKAFELLSETENWPRLLFAQWLAAESLRCQGNFTNARPMLEDVCAKAETHEQGQLVQKCKTSLGLIESALQDFDAAESHFRAAIKLTEDTRSPLPGEEFRTAFLADKLVPYMEMVRLCLDTGRTAEAFGFVERARSRALAEVMAGNIEVEFKPRDAFESKLVDQSKRLREELNYLYRQMSRASIPDKLTELQREVRARESRLSEIWRQLQHRVQQQHVTAEDFSIPELQQLLGNDTAIVEYTALGDEIIAFVVNGASLDVFRNLATGSEVAERVRQFRFQIDAVRHGSERLRQHLPQLTQRTLQPLNWIYQKLFQPLECLLGQRRVVVVPHRSLHYLPFQALHNGHEYLIEQREFSYAPSSMVFQQCLERPHTNFEKALLFAVTDEQIPGARGEIEKIVQTFPSAQSFVNEQATAAVLHNLAPTADVVHLACHAQFRSDNPLFSSLHLGDGWFTVRDSYALKLKSGLVTLSACETGVNALAPGEELIGLARGFFSAGSPSILLSLWMVDDQATEQLMVDFYQELRRTKSPSAALRQAQLQLLRERPHPFFWSPFVLVGRQ